MGSQNRGGDLHDVSVKGRSVISVLTRQITIEQVASRLYVESCLVSRACSHGGRSRASVCRLDRSRPNTLNEESRELLCRLRERQKIGDRLGYTPCTTTDAHNHHLITWTCQIRVHAPTPTARSSSLGHVTRHTVVCPKALRCENDREVALCDRDGWRKNNNDDNYA